ncbi:MAG: hypothetical protein AB2L09_11850 [Coriobacteriia bacterium]
MNETKKSREGLAKSGAIVVCLLLFLVQVGVSALFVVSSTVTPGNVNALVAKSDLLPTMVTSSAGDSDPDTLKLLTTLTSDATVKKVFAEYLSEVVADIRSGSDLANINQLALKDAVTPYMGDLVDATYPDVVEAHPIARPYLVSAAGDTVVASIEASMGDPATLLSAAGVDASKVKLARFLMGGALRGILLAAVFALGVSLIVLYRGKKVGALWWSAVSLAIGAVLVMLGASGAYVDGATRLAFAAIIDPLNSALLVVGVANVVLGAVLAVLFWLGRKKKAAAAPQGA